MSLGKFKLIPEWRLAHKLWSIRIALFWGALSGVYSFWGSLQGAIPGPAFVALGALMSAAIVGARLFKQPGVSGE